MSWNTEDEVLALALYDFSLNHTSEEFEEAIKLLSFSLSSKNVSCADNDESLCYSISALRGKCQSFCSLASDCMTPQSDCSEEDKYFFSMYITNPHNFLMRASKIAEKYDLPFFHTSDPVIKTTDNSTTPYREPLHRDREPLHNESQPQDSCVSLADEYGLNPDEYMSRRIESDMFSVRTFNALYRQRVFTVADLLQHSREDIRRIRNLGIKSFTEIITFVDQLASDPLAHLSKKIVQQNDSTQPDQFSDELLNLFKDNTESILSGDFSFASGVSQEAEEYIERFKESLENLTPQLASVCVYSPNKIYKWQPTIQEFIRNSHLISERRPILSEKIKALPENLLFSKAYYIILAYTNDEASQKCLLGKLGNENDSLELYCKCFPSEDTVAYKALLSMIIHASTPIVDDVANLLQTVFSSDRICEVVSKRAHGQTLEQIGSSMGVTRERIRQIEAKAQRHFNIRIAKAKILQKICATRNGDTVLTLAELSPYFGSHLTELVYLLRNKDSAIGYYYDSYADAFVIGDGSISTNVKASIEQLPDSFSVTDLPKYIERICDITDCPPELVEKLIPESYSLTGHIYHRSRLTLTSMYEKIFRRYYPNGIRVYDYEEIEVFKQHVVEDFGYSDLPTNYRAISVRLTDIGILAGRGIYIPKREQYISKNLEKKICNYISSSPNNAILINEIFHAFREELADNDVNSPYLLHGILRELLGDQYFFKKDYLSKDGSAYSLSADIFDFLLSHSVPVSKEEIRRAFPGASDLSISFALNDDSIIALFGDFIHGSHLPISKREISILHSALQAILDDNEGHNCREIFDVFMRDYSEILAENYVKFPFALFNLLRFLFGEEYQFSRPYIANLGVTIGRIGDQIRELVETSDEISIPEIFDIAREGRLLYRKQLDYLNEFNQSHLIINQSTLMRIEYTGLTRNDISWIEEKILEELSGTMLIAQLTCIHSFKKISVPWTEWLIYSLLNCWSTKLEVGTTSSVFKQAAPLVARKGSMDSTAYADASDLEELHIVQVDDLDNIDDLIADYILD